MVQVAQSAEKNAAADIRPHLATLREDLEAEKAQSTAAIAKLEAALEQKALKTTSQ
jgi:hypothetical protein